MNISDFRKEIDKDILYKGEQYYIDGHIIRIENQDMNFTADIQGTSEYTATVEIDESGDIEYCNCTCRYIRKNPYCSHIAALLYDIDEHYSEYVKGINTYEIQNIISNYCFLATKKTEEKVHAYISLESSDDAQYPLRYTLSLGREGCKSYALRDIGSVVDRIEYQKSFRYGSELEFVHERGIFDDKSLRLIELSYDIFRKIGSRLDGKRIFRIGNEQIEELMNIFDDGEKILFDNAVCLIKHENPEFNLKIKAADSDEAYRINIDSQIIVYSWSVKSCIFDRKESIFYITDSEYAGTMCNLLVYLQKSRSIGIPVKDMAAFYNAVLMPVSRYVSLEGAEALSRFAPPQMTAKLYIDSEDDGVCAHFVFCYGEKTYPNFYPQSTNPFCNYSAEKETERVILKYFTISDKTKKEPLVIPNDKKLYYLIADGMAEIEAGNTEVYLSEKFKRLNSRQTVRPVVGVIPSGKLLELNITADGYTIQELTDILNDYRKGNRYHRFRDGSFAILDDTVGEFVELTDILNITDNALLKGNIKVPQYRMLYLDMLKKESKNIYIKRSAEFREAVRKYKSDIEDADMPFITDTLDKTMREYQKYGFQWMKTISENGFGGILADDMGLGKTIQAIALMMYEKKNSSTHLTNLVVCPSSLVLNWECEIRKFAPELKSAAVTGAADMRDIYLANIGTYDVIITSYSLITRDISKYQKLRFHMHFIDEAQYIKNHNTLVSKAVKSVNSEIRFALTGTPVENSLAELWSIFDFIMPDYLFRYTYFKKTFENPIVAKSDKKVISALQKLIHPFILRRMKKDVLTELPDKTETFMYSLMGEEQSTIYSANVAEVKKSIKNGFREHSDRIKILALLTRLRQLCCDPSLVYDNYTGSSAKLEQCLEFVSNCVNAGHKILLFSQFTSMLEIIEKKLDEAKIKSCMLTGKTRTDERIRLVNKFNTDDTSVFLISLKAGGTGLNLTSADIVIHYDPWWNLSAQNQASDRAYRIGQKKNVQIYKLITEKTIEEKICMLQEKKAELYDIAVSENDDIMHMSMEDIMSIIG